MRWRPGQTGGGGGLPVPIERIKKSLEIESKKLRGKRRSVEKEGGESNNPEKMPGATSGGKGDNLACRI